MMDIFVHLNGPDDVRRPMTMTDYVQLRICFCIVLITDEIEWLC